MLFSEEIPNTKKFNTQVNLGFFLLQHTVFISSHIQKQHQDIQQGIQTIYLPLCIKTCTHVRTHVLLNQSGGRNIQKWTRKRCWKSV